MADQLKAGNNEDNTTRDIVFTIAIIIRWILVPIGILIHFWTCLILYKTIGGFAAFLGLIFPVIAEIYTAIQFWIATRMFFMNGYNFYVLSYCVILGIDWLFIIRFMPREE